MPSAHVIFRMMFGHFSFSNAESVRENHSLHRGINPSQKYHPTLLLFFTKPTRPILNLLAVQDSHLKQFPPIYWFFMNPPLKIRFFSKS